jgi:tetratricopeptide (TPR) repeat protein
MRALGLVAIAYCFSTLCFCQNASLVEKNLLDFETAKSESDRIDALAMAAFNSAHSNQKAGIAYGQRALEMAKAADDLRRQGDCRNSIGMCFEGLGMVDRSLQHFDTAILRFSEAGENCEIGIVKLNVGNAHKRGQNLPKALEAYSDAQKSRKNVARRQRVEQLSILLGCATAP